MRATPSRGLLDILNIDIQLFDTHIGAFVAHPQQCNSTPQLEPGTIISGQCLALHPTSGVDVHRFAISTAHDCKDPQN